MGDQFAIGAPAAMRVYSSTVRHSSRLSQLRLSEFHQQLTGHVSVAQTCWFHGIEVRKAPFKFGHLQHPKPLSLDEIAHCLEHDSISRSDASDRILLRAIQKDLISSD